MVVVRGGGWLAWFISVLCEGGGVSWWVVLEVRWLVLWGLHSVDVAAVEPDFGCHDPIVTIRHALVHDVRPLAVGRVSVELQVDPAAASPEDSVLSHVVPVGKPRPLRQRVLRLESHLPASVVFGPWLPTVVAVAPGNLACRGPQDVGAEHVPAAYWWGELEGGVQTRVGIVESSHHANDQLASKIVWAALAVVTGSAVCRPSKHQALGGSVGTHSSHMPKPLQNSPPHQMIGGRDSELAVDRVGLDLTLPLAAT
jgi:hypothetical protein